MDTFKSGSRTAIEFKETMWFYLTDVLNRSNGIPDHLVHKDHKEIQPDKSKGTALNDNQNQH